MISLFILLKNIVIIIQKQHKNNHGSAFRKISNEFYRDFLDGSKCTKCEYKCQNLKTLQIHVKNHLRLKYICQYCAKLFDAKSACQNHTKNCLRNDSKIKAKPNRIEKIKVESRTKNERKRSAKNDDNAKNQTEPFNCPVCAIPLVTAKHVLDHIEDRHFRQLYPCTACERIFESGSDWKEHWLSEHSNKPTQSRFIYSKVNFH